MTVNTEPPSSDIGGIKQEGYHWPAKATRSTVVDSDGGEITDTNPFPTKQLNSFITDPFDYIALTYVAAGNGAGEIETATYKSGGAGGTTVGILTLAYDASNRISSVTKT